MPKTSPAHVVANPERQTFINKIVSLRTENQKVTLDLKKKSAECDALMLKQQKFEQQLSEINHSLSKEMNQLLLKLGNTESELTRLKSDNAKIVSDLKLEIQTLVARNNQLKTGIMQKETLKDDVYEVEKLVGHKKEWDGMYFLVRWENFNANYDTWEHEKNLMCPQILNEYKKKMRIE